RRHTRLVSDWSSDVVLFRSWPQLAEQFPAGMELSGTINRLFDRGAIVDLGNGIEGFVPLSQLGIDDLKRPNDAFETGESLTMKVDRKSVVEGKEAGTVGGRE